MNTDENLKGHDAVAREVTSRMENNSQGEKKGVFFTLFSLMMQNQKGIFFKDSGLKVSSEKKS